MVPDSKDEDTLDAELVALAEGLRQAVGGFVRKVRAVADTPRAAWSDSLEDLDRHGSMTVAMLARLRQVRHQSMRVVVAQLEGEGFVTRAPDPADARGQIVEITRAGRAILASSRVVRSHWIAAALEVHATARERQALVTAIAVLRRLTAAAD